MEVPAVVEVSAVVELVAVVVAAVVDVDVVESAPFGVSVPEHPTSASVSDERTAAVHRNPRVNFMPANVAHAISNHGRIGR